MGTVTKYQAVRDAVLDLGADATPAAIAKFARDKFKIEFADQKELALYITMVNNKMSRKNLGPKQAPSGSFQLDRSRLRPHS